MLLGKKHNVLFANSKDYDCNARIFISYVRNQYLTNILRILEYVESILDDLTCTSKMLENDSYRY